MQFKVAKNWAARAFLALIISFASVTLTSTVNAAPKSTATKPSVTKHPTTKGVAIKLLSPLVAAQNAEGLLISGKTIVTYLNTGGVNSNIQITGLDTSGLQMWQKTIDSGVDEVATAATVDSLGNLWFAGDSAPLSQVDTSTVALPADNPDGVIAEPTTKLRSDMNLLTIWKVSPTGELLNTYSLAQGSPALVKAISVNTSGISLVGQLDEKPFLISISNAGAFGKVLPIGTSKTQLNAVVRIADGSINLFGSSSETLAGKKTVGSRDGVLVKISKSGAIAAVVRSSAPKADRAWNSADSTLALTGYVKTGKVIESAFTKFTPAFAPTWTIRIPSSGDSEVLTVGVSATSVTTYGALSSTSAITAVTGWKPATPQLAVLAFNIKGAIISACGFPTLTTPLALAYSKEIGLYGLAKALDGSISIFKVI